MSSLDSLLHDYYRLRQHMIWRLPQRELSKLSTKPVTYVHRHLQACSSVHILRLTFMVASIGFNSRTCLRFDLFSKLVVLNTAWNYFDVFTSAQKVSHAVLT